MSGRRTRLKDIAEATGFSINTVSLALRNSPLVVEGTKLAINHMAAKLSYRPNEIAKSLVQRQTRSVGLVMGNIANPILTRTAQAIASALMTHGFTTLFATSTNSVEQERKILDVFCGRQVDGVLIYPTNHAELDHIRALRQLHIPVVKLATERKEGIDTVSLRERFGGYIATRHLLELGHRRIGIIDDGTVDGNHEKIDGYQDALAEWGIPLDPKLLHLRRGNSPKLGHSAMDQFVALPDPPTAVFCTIDPVALGVLDWCARHGLKVPEDVSIIGFDDFDFAAFTATPLTTIAYDTHALATKAVERLLFLIDAADSAISPVAQTIEPHLKVRESTAPARSSHLGSRHIK